MKISYSFGTAPKRLTLSSWFKIQTGIEPHQVNFSHTAPPVYSKPAIHIAPVWCLTVFHPTHLPWGTRPDLQQLISLNLAPHTGIEPVTCRNYGIKLTFILCPSSSTNLKIYEDNQWTLKTELKLVHHAVMLFRGVICQSFILRNIKNVYSIAVNTYFNLLWWHS